MDLDSLGRQRKWNNYGCGCYQWSHEHFLWLPSLGLMRICTHAGERSADMVHGEQMMAARRCLWSVFASHGSIDALSLALLENASNFVSRLCCCRRLDLLLVQIGRHGLIHPVEGMGSIPTSWAATNWSMVWCHIFAVIGWNVGSRFHFPLWSVETCTILFYF